MHQLDEHAEQSRDPCLRRLVNLLASSPRNLVALLYLRREQLQLVDTTPESSETASIRTSLSKDSPHDPTKLDMPSIRQPELEESADKDLLTEQLNIDNPMHQLEEHAEQSRNLFRERLVNLLASSPRNLVALLSLRREQLQLLDTTPESSETASIRIFMSNINMTSADSDISNSDPEEICEWTLADLIDYELLLNDDSDIERAQLEERDNAFRKKILQSYPSDFSPSKIEDTPKTRRWWLREWLELRRGEISKSQDAGNGSVGEVVTESLTLVGGMLTILGVCLGVTSLLGMLKPWEVVDVPLLLLIYLSPQLLLLGFALVTAFKQRRGSSSSQRSVLIGLSSSLISRLFQWASSKYEEKAGNRKSVSRVHAGAALLISRARLRREALSWPLLKLFQRLGTSFGATVAVGMTIICLFSHYNFGWSSSSASIDADVVHKTVTWISKPWVLVLPEGVGYPTLDEVSSSQYFRARGTLPESFPRLSSWWVFLCMSLVFYVVLPRWLLLRYSIWRSRKALRVESFRDGGSDALFRRLSRPQLKTRSVIELDTPFRDGEETTKNEPSDAIGFNVPSGCCLVLTELELKPEEKNKVTERVENRLNLGIYSFHMAYSMKEQTESLEALSRARWEDLIPRVIFLYRANDPIVGSFRSLVNRCIPILGSEGQIIFALAGPHDLTESQADPEDVEVWKEYANKLKLKNPNCTVELLTTES